MAYDKHTVGGLLNTAYVLIGGDTCHPTWGAAKTDQVTLDSACTESATKVGELGSASEIYIRDEPLDALDLRDCVVPHARQDDWDTMAFIGNAMTLDASGCDCETSIGNYWSYNFEEYSESGSDTYWYADSGANIFGTGNWWIDAGYSWIAHIAADPPYFEVYINCVGADYLVWSGTKSCGHDPDGSYTKTGGCDIQDPLVWNKL